MTNLNTPAFPQSADINSMYIYMKSMHSFIQNLVLNGIQFPPFTQDQINAMTDLSQSGKGIYNTTDNKPYIAINNGGTLAVKEVQLI